MVSLGTCAASWLVYDVLFLCLFVFVFFMRLVPQAFFARTRMIRTYSSYVL